VKVVLSGGGTAGHVNPALALATVLRQHGHSVLFAGTPQGVEARLAKQADIPFTAFEAAGFDRERPLTLFSSTAKTASSVHKAKAWMRQVEPDVVVGFGGYVSIPVGLAASSLGIPLVVHEQNSVMGMANKFLAKRAKAVALTYEVAGKDVEDKSKITVTGNPVRASIFEATRAQGREMLSIPEDATMLLVFGGSLGARHINEAFERLKDRLLAVDGLYVVHLTGPKEYQSVVDALALTDEQKPRWQLFDYMDRMAETLNAADCVVSRAGATSLAEISALRIPALLVPFPYATEDHQTVNAREYVAAGAAYMMADDALDTPEFDEKLFEIIQNPQVREDMRAAAAKLKTEDAAANLADIVERAARA
jgi:UDP-N-acetylglucosamine--N-acetylmuramyl-(pentapeptide) pyrophosphoryl-undecaprenol N-acetylglucosamine transferase